MQLLFRGGEQSSVIFEAYRATGERWAIRYRHPLSAFQAFNVAVAVLHNETTSMLDVLPPLDEVPHALMPTPSTSLTSRITLEHNYGAMYAVHSYGGRVFCGLRGTSSSSAPSARTPSATSGARTRRPSTRSKSSAATWSPPARPARPTVGPADPRPRRHLPRPRCVPRRRRRRVRSPAHARPRSRHPPATACPPVDAMPLPPRTQAGRCAASRADCSPTASCCASRLLRHLDPSLGHDDAPPPKEAQKLPAGHGRAVRSLVLSCDGSRFALRRRGIVWDTGTPASCTRCGSTASLLARDVHGRRREPPRTRSTRGATAASSPSGSSRRSPSRSSRAPHRPVALRRLPWGGSPGPPGPPRLPRAAPAPSGAPTAPAPLSAPPHPPRQVRRDWRLERNGKVRGLGVTGTILCSGWGNGCLRRWTALAPYLAQMRPRLSRPHRWHPSHRRGPHLTGASLLPPWPSMHSHWRPLGPPRPYHQRC